MKKMISVLLLAAMVLSMIPVLGGCNKNELRTHEESTTTTVHTRTIPE